MGFELTVVVVQVPASEVPGLDLRGRLLSPEQPRLWLTLRRRVLAVGVDVHPADLALQALPGVTYGGTSKNKSLSSTVFNVIKLFSVGNLNVRIPPNFWETLEEL